MRFGIPFMYRNGKIGNIMLSQFFLLIPKVSQLEQELPA